MERYAAAAAVMLLCYTGVRADYSLYSEGSPVITLNSSTFGPTLENNHVALVNFGAPWSGHCKHIVSRWEQVAAGLKGFMLVAWVDCYENADLGKELGIWGYPDVKFMYMEDGKVKAVSNNSNRSATFIIPWAFRLAKELAMKRIGGDYAIGGYNGLES